MRGMLELCCSSQEGGVFFDIEINKIINLYGLSKVLKSASNATDATV